MSHLIAVEEQPVIEEQPIVKERPPTAEVHEPSAGPVSVDFGARSRRTELGGFYVVVISAYFPATNGSAKANTTVNFLSFVVVQYDCKFPWLCGSPIRL